MECGSCSYACPSNIPIVQLIRVSKSWVRERQRDARIVQAKETAEAAKEAAESAKPAAGTAKEAAGAAKPAAGTAKETAESAKPAAGTAKTPGARPDGNGKEANR
jgi:Na+-translocating ferredoxin:NAD+ oxidoreductase RnfC subunit